MPAPCQGAAAVTVADLPARTEPGPGVVAADPRAAGRVGRVHRRVARSRRLPPVALDPHDLPPAALEFLRERHLATLTTLRPDGSPHVVPVGFTFDLGTATVRVITSGASRKARNVRDGSRAVVAQVDGRRWLALEGPGRLLTAAEEVADAERRYAERYRTPRPNPQRVVVVVDVDRVLGSVPPWD